jgi:hypothetical protein
MVIFYFKAVLVFKILKNILLGGITFLFFHFFQCRLDALLEVQSALAGVLREHAGDYFSQAGHKQYNTTNPHKQMYTDNLAHFFS